MVSFVFFLSVFITYAQNNYHINFCWALLRIAQLTQILELSP